MTAGTAIRTRGSTQPLSSNGPSREYFKHSSAKRVNTDAVVVDAIRAEYPQLHLTVIERYSVDLLSWASAGHAELTAIDKEQDQLRWRNYLPPANKLGGPTGTLTDSIKFGKFLLNYDGKEFVVFIADTRDGSKYSSEVNRLMARISLTCLLADPYPTPTMQYVLSSSVDATNTLLVQAGVWTNELHDEIWVFDQGYWQKSSELYESIKKASWDDVILNSKQKNAMINDVDNFYNSQDTYKRLNIPWKRGVIYHGPPGIELHSLDLARLLTRRFRKWENYQHQSDDVDAVQAQSISPNGESFIMKLVRRFGCR